MKKGQAAMEFLMTYGWAILVVLAAIGALAYFGVLSPDRFLPDKCTANPPFACNEYKADSAAGAASDLFMMIQNSAGTEIAITEFSVTCDGGTTTALLSGSEVVVGNTTPLIQNGAAVPVNITDMTDAGCAALSQGAKLRATYDITYQKSGETVSHTGSGSVQVRVE